VGTACGSLIMDRVQSELETMIGPKESKEFLSDAKINYNDTLYPWWTSFAAFDSKSEAQSRELEFLNYLQHCGDDYPIFVGHSLYFRNFYSKRISRSLALKRPRIAEELTKLKLSNATVLALTIHFGDDSGGWPVGFSREKSVPRRSQIVDAELIFGNGFHMTSSAARKGGVHGAVSNLDGNMFCDADEEVDSEDEKVNQAGPNNSEVIPRRGLTRQDSKSAVLGRVITSKFKDTLDDTRGLANKLSGKLDKWNQKIDSVTSGFATMFGLGKSVDSTDR
jgi:hypothetical protein